MQKFKGVSTKYLANYLYWFKWLEFFKSEKRALKSKQLLIHAHSSHINVRIKDFQGRRFEITKEIPFQKNDLKKYIQNQKMNVTTRNFPLKVEDIKKKYKISDGGTLFAFFTTNLKNEKIVLLCTKI